MWPGFVCMSRVVQTGELSLRDIKKWVLDREDISSYLLNFIEARMIISSLQVKNLFCSMYVFQCSTTQSR